MMQCPNCNFYLILFLGIFFLGCGKDPDPEKELAQRIREDTLFDYVETKALEIIRTGFNAGDGYGEVWIRDFNTFIELSCEVFDQGTIKDHLLVFFRSECFDAVAHIHIG